MCVYVYFSPSYFFLENFLENYESEIIEQVVYIENM